MMIVALVLLLMVDLMEMEDDSIGHGEAGVIVGYLAITGEFP